MNLSEHEIEKRERQRQEEMRRELEKVKKRRLVRITRLLCYASEYSLMPLQEREKEREQRDDEMVCVQKSFAVLTLALVSLCHRRLSCSG